MEVTKLNKICLKGTDTIQLLPASISSVVEKLGEKLEASEDSDREARASSRHARAKRDLH